MLCTLLLAVEPVVNGTRHIVHIWGGLPFCFSPKAVCAVGCDGQDGSAPLVIFLCA